MPLSEKEKDMFEIGLDFGARALLDNGFAKAADILLAACVVLGRRTDPLVMKAYQREVVAEFPQLFQMNQN